MRSGHYKLTCPKNGNRSDGETIFVGQFRAACREHPASAPPYQTGPFQFPLDLNSLPMSTLRRDEFKNDRQEMMIRACREQILKEEKRGDGIFRHRSCENVNFLSRGAVNRFEQKVRALWLKGEAKRRSETSFHSHNEGFDGESSRMDHWQSGRIVTMHKKNRLLAAHSHSALNTLNTSSDTASCLSASSGYSSSSSSSYGSFKSSGSVGSTLPRHRNNSSRSQSPTSDNRTFFVDNPLYDVSPASALDLDNPTFCEPSGQESFSSGEFSLGDSAPSVPSLPDPFQDPLAKECKEFFERRLEASENLRRKWSLYVPEKNIFEPDRNIDSELISKGDAIVDSKFNAGCEMSFGVESNFQPTDIISPHFPGTSCQIKNKLDEKMELLRHEIASLIQKDTSLFRQLLTLHDSINDLKVQTAYTHTHRPLTPSDLDSFTEEEEEEEDEEGARTLHEGGSESGKEEASAGNDTVRREGVEGDKRFQIPQSELRVGSDKQAIEDEEDEGHGTDLSLGHTPSHSPSPASTLSSNSSKDSSYSRSLYSEMASDFSGSFTRCRKSYAPNARNRRRASSVHRQKSPQLDCGTTTALVLVHTDDVDALLNPSRPRAHSFTPLTTFSVNDALSYTQSSDNLARSSSKQAPDERSDGEQSPSSSLTSSQTNENNAESQSYQPIRTLASCYNQSMASSPLCGSYRPNLAHPPYREALIM